MKIIPLVVGQLATNSYIVIDESSNEAIIVDPGDDADYIVRVLNDNHAVPVQIIATHGHFDHILAVLELKLAYNIPFYLHKDDEFLVKNMQSSAYHFMQIHTDPPPPIDGFLKETITWGKSKLKVIHTPGHTPGSVCLYDKKNNTLITGDLIFAQGGVGRTDFSYSSTEDLYASLQKVFKLPGETQIFPGHGESSTLEKEKAVHGR